MLAYQVTARASEANLPPPTSCRYRLDRKAGSWQNRGMTSTNAPAIQVTSYGDTLTITPHLFEYGNHRLAIGFDCEDGPYAKLTVNLPDEHLNEGELFIKDWSENESMVAALLEAGWLELTGREVNAGFTFPKVMRPAGPLLTFIQEERA